MMANLTRRNFVDTASTISLLGVLGAHVPPAGAVNNAVSVLDFRLRQDDDDTAAFQRAIATRRPVYVPGGAGLGPGGVYLVRDVALTEGVDLFGDGIGQTILRPSGNHAAFYCDSGSASTWIAGIRISKFTLEGWVLERGFAEHQHLAHLNGVQNVVIENVEFKAFQGDGLFLGSGRQADITRHNRGITIRGCVFDGVNNDNRNGISVIDGEGILIEDCIFENCTRPNMPGAIDFEPDATRAAIIRDIVIRRCRFLNVGGNVGTIGFHIPPEVMAVPGRIVISENVFRNYRGLGGEIYFNVNRVISTLDPSMDVLINDNRGSGGQWVYRFYAVKGVNAVGNRWKNYKQGAMIGYLAASQSSHNIKMSDELVGCGQISGVGIYIFNASRLTLERCLLIDCGNGTDTSYGICFSRGTSEFVTLADLQVRTPGRKTHVAVIREQLHILSPGTNVQHRNDFGGLPGIDISQPV